MKSLTNEEIANLRVDYTLKRFDEEDVLADPMDQFREWFQEALSANVNEPNAMTLATIKSDGTPSARIVLLKGIRKEGITFFTNYNSRKGEQMNHNPNVAVVFCWLELQRQVRMEGTITRLNDSENDEYFNSRPLGSQLGAIASPQSTIIKGRGILESNYERAKAIAESDGIHRPEHWGGYLIKPNLIEFWQGRSSRLHDRLEFRLDKETWKRNRLAP